MRTLREMLASERDCAYLRERGVFVRRQDFEAALGKPISDALTGLRPHDPDARPVYFAQQIYADYRWSVLRKLSALEELASDERIYPLLIWVDTDRAGSDKLSASFSWPTSGKHGGVNLVPTRAREAETRYLRLDRDQIGAAKERLRNFVRSEFPRPRAQLLARFEAIADVLDDPAHETLKSLNKALTDRMLSHYLDRRMDDVFLSDLFARGFLNDAVGACLNELEGWIATFNAAVQALRDMDIDAKVTERPQDYLPLYLTCPEDLCRLPLRRERDRGGTFAVARCGKCGAQHRLYLGSRPPHLSVTDLGADVSPDVCMPAFVNHLFSGAVGGQSSALYALVLNEVTRTVLGEEPIAILVPRDLFTPAGPYADVDGLLYNYLRSR